MFFVVVIPFLPSHTFTLSLTLTPPILLVIMKS